MRNYKICEHCQKSFSPVRGDSKFCSAKCRQAAYRKRLDPETGSRKNLRQRARNAVATKQSITDEFVCKYCGKTSFKTRTEGNRVYCSDACKQAAYRDRKKRQAVKDKGLQICVECGETEHIYLVNVLDLTDRYRDTFQCKSCGHRFTDDRQKPDLHQDDLFAGVSSDDDLLTRWKCNKCGQIYAGAVPPSHCAFCARQKDFDKTKISHWSRIDTFQDWINQ